MKKQFLTLSALGLASLLITSCNDDISFQSKLEKTLSEKPEVLYQALAKNPEKLMQTIQEAVKAGQKNAQLSREQQEEKQIQAAILNPLQPEINAKQIIQGPKDAPITIVEYSDFECPYCARSKSTISSLLDKYPGKVRVIYKHLPLSFHPAAMISAKYYEAIRLQSSNKASLFHDKVFSNQSGLKNGEAYLASVAEELKVDMVILQKDLHSNIVKEKIQADIAEAQSFQFQGTPGFIINGVPVKGAYPVEHFERIINQLKEKGKLIL